MSQGQSALRNSHSLMTSDPLTFLCWCLQISISLNTHFMKKDVSTSKACLLERLSFLHTYWVAAGIEHWLQV